MSFGKGEACLILIWAQKFLPGAWRGAACCLAVLAVRGASLSFYIVLLHKTIQSFRGRRLE